MPGSKGSAGMTEKVREAIAASEAEAAAEAELIRSGGGGVSHSFAKGEPVGEGAAAPGSPRTERAEGNQAFREKEFAAATRHYSAAIEQLQGAGAGQDDAKEMLKVCMLNRAACALQLGHFREVVKDCSAVLKDEPLNVKALFRRAKAQSNMRTDILSVSNAKQDLHMASIIAPNDRQIAALKAQVEADLPQLEQKLLDLHYRDKPFWTVGESVMVTRKGHMKLGGRGCLQPGEMGVVRDVDEELKAGGRVQVQNLRTAECYWYDMEELDRAYIGEETVEGEGKPQQLAESGSVEAAAESAAAQEERVTALGDGEDRTPESAAATTETPATSSSAAGAEGGEASDEAEEGAGGAADRDAEAERDIDDILAAMADDLRDMSSGSPQPAEIQEISPEESPQS